jgi:acyl carrier protein
MMWLQSNAIGWVRTLRPGQRVAPIILLRRLMDTLEQFVEKFSNAVDFQEAVEFSGETDLKALPEWDSLAALGVIIMFDMEYNKAITGADLYACKKLIDVYNLVG